MPGRLKGVLWLPAFSGGGESIHWFLFARLFVLFVVLAWMIALDSSRWVLQSSLNAYALLSVSFCFTLLSAVFLEKGGVGQLAAAMQIAFDALVTGLWLKWTGVVAGALVLVFIVQIMAAALTFYKRGAWFSCIATTSAFVIGAHHAIDWVTVATYGLLFIVIGTTGGYLAEELARTTRTLATREQTIQKLAELQKQILMYLPTGLLTVDKDLLINFANPAAIQILGIPKATVVGSHLAEIAPGLLPFFSSIEMETIAGDASLQGDLEAASTRNHKHRSVFVHSRNDTMRLGQRVEWVEGSKVRVLRGDVADLGAAIEGSGLLHANATEGRLVLFQDVTIVDQLEQRLRQNEKLAAVGQLAAGIAHEIRNPLASMSASIEMLMESVPRRNDDNHKLMEITIREIDRMNELITEFLDYVKPIRPKIAPFNLGELVEEIAAQIKLRKDLPQGASVTAHVENNLVIEGSREKIGQVVLNLSINALQAIAKNGRISVGCLKQGTQALLFVQDDGCGMKEEIRGHLFEPFFTTKPKGTGLGLATVYKIVEAHAGTVRFTSELGKGSRFEVLLEMAG